ncbi:MAG: DNA-binding response regulator [uncultured Sulfurovum sp.]|uniref:DNA-binding response regulator n=1 Tax=uncultured Sulfurovum sp. TaxID=269237 RepID=A0A6S6U1T3_9BACT|nr:MAG: DNA-binding response regulator [uncultured Sulfurovum sp.]
MRKNTTILYVDDNSLIREEAVEYLSLIYNKVLEASNGQEALNIYKETKPDIIITDIEMPIMNGLQMVKSIRRQDKNIPIIIVTAFLHTEYLLEAIELHLIKYIVKPISNYKLDIALELAHEYLRNEEKKCILQLAENSYYDQLNKVLTINKKVISLTHNEMLLLSLLSNNPNNVVTYTEIKNKIWHYQDNYIDSLRSLIRSLRIKLEDITINNISGIGYRIIIKYHS